MVNHDRVSTTRSSYPRLKVLYLIGVSLGVFLIPPVLRPVWPGAAWLLFLCVAAVLSLQVGLLLAHRVPVQGILAVCARLKWLFIFVILCATFFRNMKQGGNLPENPPGTMVSAVQVAGNGARSFSENPPGADKSANRSKRKRDAWIVANLPRAPHWRVNFNVTGLQASVLMCLQITTVILVSSLVRVTGESTDLVEGLRGLKFPQLFCYSIDNTLALIGGVRPRPVGGRTGDASRQGKGGGGGKGRRGAAQLEGAETSPGFLATLGRLMRGDLSFFLDAIRANQERSKQRIEETMGPSPDARLVHDAAIISGIGVMMMSMKMLKVLPGISFASGYKTLLLIPLYLLASRLTYSRWGGTVAGSIMGVLGLMIGDGKTGVFEVIKHIAPGFVIDLLDPVVSRLPPRKIVYCALAFVAAVARTLADLALVIVPALSAGNFWENPEILLFPAYKLIPNIFFGTISGIVAYYVVRDFSALSPGPPGVQPERVLSPKLSPSVIGASTGPEDANEEASISRGQD